MKKLHVLLAVLFAVAFIPAWSQVAINNDNSAPDGSSMLDIKASNAGVLIPRLTMAQRNAIATPATGLLIFQNDNSPGFYYFDGAFWFKLGNAGSNLTNGKILIGDVTSQAVEVYISGDAILSNLGVLTIGPGKINSGKIQDNTILGSDINVNAGIEATKIFSGNVDNTEFGYLDGLTGIIQDQINGESTSRQNADNNLQAELNTTQAGAELNADGTYTPTGGTSYISLATSLKDADNKLDVQVHTNAADINSNATAIGGITARFGPEGTVESSRAVVVDAGRDIGNFNNIQANGTISAQKLGVGTSTPNPCAALEVQCSSMGILLPRLTTVQKNGISGPVSGLLVFDTDTDSFWFWDAGKSAWAEIKDSGNNRSIADGDGDTYITVEKNPDEDTTRFYIAGTEKLRLSQNMLEQVNTGQSVFLGEDAGEHDDLSLNRNVLVGYQAGKTGITAEGATGIGYMALNANTVGYKNTAVGYVALRACDNGNRNTAVGAHSLENNVGGTSNTAVGYASLYQNSSGIQNTALGLRALSQNTTGSSNVAIGHAALYNNIGNDGLIAIGDSAQFRNGIGTNPNYHGQKNIAIGSNALYGNLTGNENVAIGYHSLLSNSNGGRHIAIGPNTLLSNTEGSENIAIGNYTMLNNTIGEYNTAVGHAMVSNISGSFNVAIGGGALNSNISGSYNTIGGRIAAIGGLNATGSFNSAWGAMALYSLRHGHSNIAVGISSLYMNQDISNLVAIGDSALYNNGSGSPLAGQAVYNTAVGSKSLYTNTIGSYNTAVGNKSLYLNNDGFSNTAIGYLALYANQSGNNNSAAGWCALVANTSGPRNTANGYQSLMANTQGYDNTAVGYEALKYNTINGMNTAVGSNAGPAYNGYYNTSALGYNAMPWTSNDVRLGNNLVDWIGGNSLWMFTSDGRFKKDVKENIPGLDFILHLRPVSFRFDIQGLNSYQGVTETNSIDENSNISMQKKESIVYSGLIAQEVEQAAKKLGYDFCGVHVPENEHDVYSIAYSSLVMPLIKAIQEQQAQIEALEKRIRELEAETMSDEE